MSLHQLKAVQRTAIALKVQSAKSIAQACATHIVAVETPASDSASQPRHLSSAVQTSPARLDSNAKVCVLIAHLVLKIVRLVASASACQCRPKKNAIATQTAPKDSIASLFFARCSASQILVEDACLVTMALLVNACQTLNEGARAIAIASLASTAKHTAWGFVTPPQGAKINALGSASLQDANLTKIAQKKVHIANLHAPQIACRLMLEAGTAGHQCHASRPTV